MPVSVNNGVLGQSTPVASTLTDLYTSTANATASGSLTICNRNAVAVLIRVAVVKSGVTTYLRYGTPLAPEGEDGSFLDLRPILLTNGEKIQVWSDTASVDFTFAGYESPANFLALD